MLFDVVVGLWSTLQGLKTSWSIRIVRIFRADAVEQLKSEFLKGF